MTTETPTAEPFDAFEQRLTAVLAAEATAVLPPADGRDRISARVAHRRRARRATWFAAAAAVVLVAGFVGLALRSSDTDSAPYVDIETDGSGVIRTPDAMEADWDHPRLLVPGDSQWRVSTYLPWQRYDIGAVLDDGSGPRRVGLTVEVTGPDDAVTETWPLERRGQVDGGEAVLTATEGTASILWHPAPGLTARLTDSTEADAAAAERMRLAQEAFDEWARAGGTGEPPSLTSLASSTGQPVAVEVGDDDAARMERMAAGLVAVDRSTWLRAVDSDGAVFVTGDGPAQLDEAFGYTGGGGTPRVMVPEADGTTAPRLSPGLATTSYRFDVDGFPAETFELEVSLHDAASPFQWEPVREVTQGAFGAQADPYTPIFSPATVRGGAGEFEHYSITTLDRTNPDAVRSLRWISDGYSWLLRFRGSASGEDAVAFADSLVVPDDEAWESVVFPADDPGVWAPASSLHDEWLRVTGRYVPCQFGQVCD